MPSPTVELAMIVKDEAATLSRCLSSIQGAVNRILIGDTGSSDDTKSIARKFGAHVIDISWTGDFSAARNAVLRQCTCDWILVLDADEMLDPSGTVSLRNAVRNERIAGYEVWRWNYVLETNSRSGEHGALKNPGTLKEAAPYPAYVRSLNTRLFRRHSDIYFERPVHETVAHRLKSLQLPVASAPFVIHHFGQAEDASARAHKNELYHQIGLDHLKHHPDDARTCFELGLGELEHYRRPEAALQLFLRAIQIDPLDNNSLLFAGVCLVRLKRFPEALKMLARSAAINSCSLVLHETTGDAHYYQRAYSHALKSYSEAHAQGSTSALILAKRGVCEIYLGHRDSGMRSLKQALEREPRFPELLDIVTIGAALAHENRFAAEVAQRRLLLPGAQDLHYELAGKLHGIVGKLA